MRIYFILSVLFTSINYIKGGIQIEYEVLYAEDNPLVDKNLLLPEKLVLSIDKECAKLEKFYRDKEAGKYEQYFDLNDNIYVEKYIIGNNDFAYLMQKLNYNITYLHQESKYHVLEYPCKRAIASYKDEQIEIYYAETLGYQFFPYGDLNGIALLYRVKDPIFKEVVFNAIKVTELNFNPKFFNPPKPDRDRLEYGSEEFELLNQPAPAIKVRNLNNDKLDISFDEGKITVLNFWFVGCPPCREEIPKLNQLCIKYLQDKSVQFVAISTDRVTYVKSFMARNEFYYQVYGSGMQAAADYDVFSYPTHIIIDPHGKIVYYRTGYGPATAFKLDEQINQLKKKHFVNGDR